MTARQARAGAAPRLPLGVAAIICAAGGLAQAIALAPQPRGWLQLLGAAALAFSVAGRRPRAAFGLGWLFGTCWIAGAVWWLFISMHRYGGLPAPAAVVAVAALAAALALYLGAAMALLARASPAGPLRLGLGFAGAWLMAELARAAWFTGFPWGASGYAHVDGSLAAAAPWVGIYGIGALAALAAGWWGGGLAAWIGRRGASAWQGPVLCALMLLMAPLAQRDFTRDSGTLTVTLVQTNVAQDEKFAAQHLALALKDLAVALRDAPGTLVIAPETAVPLLPAQLAELLPGWWPGLQAQFRDGRHALVGLPLGDAELGYTNSALGLSDGQVRYRYDKFHLVPFGEFIPPGFRWFTEAMNIPLGDFARGPLGPPPFEAAGQRIAATICYEDLFGEELALRFDRPQQAPTLLANISNIGWFGNTVAIDQHRHISRMRSLEFQRPMVRATNTGATAAIDHRGRVLAELEPFTRRSLTQAVQGRDGRTPYAAWMSSTGLWPLWLLALALIGASALGRRLRPAT